MGINTIMFFILSWVLFAAGVSLLVYMKKNDYFCRFDVERISITFTIVIMALMFISGMGVVNFIKDSSTPKMIETTDPTIKELCEEYSVSETLVYTIAEYTGEEEGNIVILMKYCSDNEMDLPDAIMMSKPGLTTDEANAILLFSDMRQAKEAASETPALIETKEEK